MPTQIKYEFEARGAIKQLFECRDEEVLVEGPAGTGKSTGVLMKIYVAGMKYPNARMLLVRQTRASLTETGIKTFEDDVCVPGDGVRFIDKKQSFLFPKTKATLRVGGLDDPTKIMSAQYDIIFVQEAIETKLSAWEDLITRLRNYKLPYQQLIADTNPGRWTHWLNQRAINGTLKRLISRHTDNPAYWDAVNKCWTEKGKAYMKRLSERLSGLKRQRLYEGKWVNAEGIVYPEFDHSVHVIPRFDIPKDWDTFWTIDWGYTNPFVFQAWAVDHDGRMYRFKEIYRTQRIVEDHCKTIKSLDLPRPKFIVCDHDIEDRKTFEKHMRMTTRPAYKDVSTGLQGVRDRLVPAKDGKPRIFWMENSLVEKDQYLVEQMHPVKSEDEFELYEWDLRNGLLPKEQPLKRYDHGKDSERYAVAEKDNLARKPKPGIIIL